MAVYVRACTDDVALFLAALQDSEHWNDSWTGQGLVAAELPSAHHSTVNSSLQASELVADNIDHYHSHMKTVRDYLEQRLLVHRTSYTRSTGYTCMCTVLVL